MYNIVLVEDEKDLNNLIKMYLEKEGYTVTSYYSGTEALNNIKISSDLWILDIMLGDDISGYDIIKKVREFNENVPVIFTSARDKDLAKNIDIIAMENRSEILYNLGGYLNHSLYFFNLTDKKKDIPNNFIDLIKKDFSSFNSFKEDFINMALEVKGSGYTFLVIDKNNKLRIVNMTNQDTPYYYGFTPIMTIDVWEHSYYLKYYYDRREYLERVFNIIDFEKVYNLYLINQE